jgi:FdhD protein
MTRDAQFGPIVRMHALRVTPDQCTSLRDSVAAEIPLTIVANDVELATLLASPSDLKELTYGYLFTSGFIASADEATGFTCDNERWTAHVTIARSPDPSLTSKRLYTSGCGKCAMYTTVNELSLRVKLENLMCLGKQEVFDIAARLRDGTAAFVLTGSVHSAFLINTDDKREIVMDDVARHNAVDKVVGRALLEGFDFSRSILARSGRTSSEIVYKTRRCGIPITVARGAPTHQAVHLAKEMGITVIGFARPGSFNVYSCEERIVP